MGDLSGSDSRHLASEAKAREKVHVVIAWVSKQVSWALENYAPPSDGMGPTGRVSGGGWPINRGRAGRYRISGQNPSYQCLNSLCGR